MAEQLRGPFEKFVDSLYSKRDRHRTSIKFRLEVIRWGITLLLRVFARLAITECIYYIKKPHVCIPPVCDVTS
jgi:hypothetical protein